MQLCGYIGVVLYAIFLFRAICRGIVDFSEKLSTKHNSLQLFLFVFVLFKVVYYSALAVEGEDLPIPYAFRIFSNFFLTLTFLIFTGMWGDILTRNKKFRRTYDAVIQLLALVYAVVTVGITTVLFYSNGNIYTLFDELGYQLYAVFFPSLVIVLGTAFFMKALSAYCGGNVMWEGREKQGILRRFMLIVILSVICGVMLLTTETILFIQGSSNDIREQMPLALFFLLDQWLPNICLLLLMLQFTHRDSDSSFLLHITSHTAASSQSYHGDRVRFDEAKNAIIHDTREWSASATPSSSASAASSGNSSFYDLASRTHATALASANDQEGHSVSAASASFDHDSRAHRVSRDSMKQPI